MIKVFAIALVFLLGIAGTVSAQTESSATNIWLYAIGSVVLVSLLAFIGIFAVSVRRENLERVLLYLVSFSAGALLGDAFIHLLPEAVEEFGFGTSMSLYVLAGILVSFGFEKVIHWHHGHFFHENGSHNVKPFAVMNLLGDAIHNFIDGLVIGASYLVSIPVGVATTVAVIFHEIPQEIGDFGVLIHGGFQKKKALMLNFFTAATSVLGAVIALGFAMLFEGLTAFLVPFSAGAFIYIAASDLIPELHKETRMGRSLLQVAVFILGILVMYSLLFLE